MSVKSHSRQGSDKDSSAEVSAMKAVGETPPHRRGIHRCHGELDWPLARRDEPELPRGNERRGGTQPAANPAVVGGGGGIRTHGRLPFTRFPSVPIRPLSHPSPGEARVVPQG